MKLLVYTAIFGPDTDPLQEPEIPASTLLNAEFLCLTDQPLTSDIWKIRHTAQEKTCGDRFKGPQMWNRTYKSACVPDWEDYDASLYIDAGLRLTCNPLSLCVHLFRYDMVTLSHPSRTTIEQEADAIERLHGVDRKLLDAQIKRLRTDWPEQTRLTPGGLLLRRHANRVWEFNQRWYNEIVLGGHPRDQMSIDYCIHKSGLDVLHLPGHYRNNPWCKFRRAPKIKRTKP